MLKYADVLKYAKIEDLEDVYDPATRQSVYRGPVKDKKSRISKEDIRLLAKALKLEKEQGVQYGYIRPDRDLYLHGVTRYRKPDESLSDALEYYLDIRDKKDPKFRYDDSIDHSVSWTKGNNTFEWNG